MRPERRDYLVSVLQRAVVLERDRTAIGNILAGDFRAYQKTDKGATCKIGNNSTTIPRIALFFEVFYYMLTNRRINPSFASGSYDCREMRENAA